VHVQAVVTAYIFAKHLKPRQWRTHFESICDQWTAGPADPDYLTLRPHT
jgi:hypothetical protein